MNQFKAKYVSFEEKLASRPYFRLIGSFLSGLLLPFGFAPFHLPGSSLLGVALLFAFLNGQPRKSSFIYGFVFGLGYFGLGVSWVYVSIHEYGHIHEVISALITLMFVFFLSLYPGAMSYLYVTFRKKTRPLVSCLMFSALWCLSEYGRSTLLGGFPWLLLGVGQLDTPLKEILPILGIYGVSFFACFAATALVMFIQVASIQRYVWLCTFVGTLIIPSVLHEKVWGEINPTPVSVGIIQANLSMRNKWDENIFWQLLRLYQNNIEDLISKNRQLIILPESAIPISSSYISDFLETLDIQAKRAGSSILIGMIEENHLEEPSYYNALNAFGDAKGLYIKQHLVPFGEFTPKPFESLMKWLDFPMSNMTQGQPKQDLIQVKHLSIASLICYEIAYPDLVRQQLPEAGLIVSVSDDGWFGHSLAVYQQLQMAQALAKQTARYHVTVNNDGLSSIIDSQGYIISSLPTFTSGILEGNIYSTSGSTPWVIMGDKPLMVLFALIILLTIILENKPIRMNQFLNTSEDIAP